jgi:SPW repeat
VNVRRRRLPLAAGAVVAWIAVSPWAWGFADSHPAVANHVFMVFSFGPLAAMIAVLRPAALATLAAGLWLALSPWILGYASDHAAWLDELITGALLVALSSAAAGLVRRSRPARSRLRRERGGRALTR